MKKLLFLQVAAALSAFAVTAPNTLVVKSATNRVVQLAWQAGGAETNQYIVERRPLDGATFSSIGAVAPDINKVLATVFNETSFDPFTAYVYRVRAVNTLAIPVDVSDPTNEVTVGPPPYGFNRVVATPDGLDDAARFGRHTNMVLDPSGDPMMIYLYLDPNGDADYSDTELWFFRWDRAHFVWTKPVKVATIGDVASGSTATISARLACDASNGAVGVIYEDLTKISVDNPDGSLWQISMADSSDGGVTWRRRVVASDHAEYNYPALAMGAGKVYLSYYHDFDGVRYQTGKLSDDPTTWSTELAPTLGSPYYQRTSDVALDSAGKPGMAYEAVDDSGNYTEFFYRPGGQAVVASVSSYGPGDYWSLRLSFSGTNPRIAFAGAMDENYFDDYDHLLWMLVSNDGGTTFLPRVNLPSDGNSFLSSPMDVAFDSTGRGAVVTEINGGNSGGVVCGVPKLSLSSDMQNWKMCGITATYTSNAYSPSVRFAFNDTIYMGFQVPDYPFDPTTGLELPPGVYFWRGPVGFQFPTPPPAQ